MNDPVWKQSVGAKNAAAAVPCNVSVARCYEETGRVTGVKWDANCSNVASDTLHWDMTQDP